MYLSGLTNQPKSNMFDSDEDDETASQQYLKQVGFFIYFFTDGWKFGWKTVCKTQNTEKFYSTCSNRLLLGSFYYF